MKRFVQIEFHDYMDLHPTVDTRVFSGEDEESLNKAVNEFVEHMKSHWCSGTTRLIGILTKEDARAFINEQIAHEKANWQEDSQEFIDRIEKAYRESYE